MLAASKHYKAKCFDLNDSRIAKKAFSLSLFLCLSGACAVPMSQTLPLVICSFIYSIALAMLLGATVAIAAGEGDLMLSDWLFNRFKL